MRADVLGCRIWGFVGVFVTTLVITVQSTVIRGCLLPAFFFSSRIFDDLWRLYLVCHTIMIGIEISFTISRLYQPLFPFVSGVVAFSFGG